MTIQNGGTKPWVRVWTAEEGSLVAFEDMFDMLRGIIRCEVIKYGGNPDDPKSWARWGKMPGGFMEDALAFDATYEALAKKHLFPPKPAASPVSITSAPATAATFIPDDDFYAAWDAIEARTSA